MPTFNPKAEQPTYELLTGNYPFEIVKVENKISKGPRTNGCDTREITLDFYRDDSFSEKVASIRDTLIEHESCDWKFSVLAKCVHFLVAEGEAFDIAEDWYGYRGWAHCAPEADKVKKDENGKPMMWNRIRAYIATKNALTPRILPTASETDDAAFGKQKDSAMPTDDDDCPF